MWCIRGEFDPETGGRLHNRLVARVDKLFHDASPDTAPSDPLQKQHHLRALALIALIDGTGAKAGGVDMSILIDSTTLVHGPHDASVIDFGLPIDLPIDTIRRMACVADVTPIIVGADGVKLYLGDTTRLATPDQRRALRALYRTCAVPGCCLAWDTVVIHHLKYYGNQGPTDIDNLLPLCVKHHHYAHEGRWQFKIAADRTLTITLPDGAVSCHGPPEHLPHELAENFFTKVADEPDRGPAYAMGNMHGDSVEQTICSSGGKHGETLPPYPAGMDEPMIVSRTLILIDPSSPHGEGGLDVLTDDDRAVTLLLTLDGRSASSLRDFAKAEDIDVSMAGLIYLDQVVRRLSMHTDDIETISTTGSDAVNEIFHVLQHRPVTRVIVPASLPGLGGEGLGRLLHACPVPVVVAPSIPPGGSQLRIAS